MRAATSFTELVGCELPIQSAPMGAVSGPELVAAVTSAGAMAMTGFPLLSAAQAAEALESMQAVAHGPVGVNLLVPILDRAVLEAVAARAALVDLYHAPVDAELVAVIHAGGALAGWQVGSVEEASAAEAAGCDVIVVRGIEGGGRMYGERPLRPLLDEVLAAVREVPVLAAGGVSTAADVAALLDAGAAGVRVGTRLLATRESGAHERYKQAVIASEETVLTDAFHVLWPDPVRTSRVLRSCLDAAASLADDAPVGAVTTPSGDRLALPRYAVVPPTANVEGAVEAMALYAGAGVVHVTGEEPAADVIRGLAADL